MNDVTQNGADDVKRHRWFKGLDWDEVFYRKLKVNKRPCLISPSRHNNNKTYANKIIFLLLLKLYPFQILSIFEFFLFFFLVRVWSHPSCPKSAMMVTPAILTNTPKRIGSGHLASLKRITNFSRASKKKPGPCVHTNKMIIFISI